VTSGISLSPVVHDFSQWGKRSHFGALYYQRSIGLIVFVFGSTTITFDFPIGDVVSTALVPDPAVEPTMKVDRVARAYGISRAAAYQAVLAGEIPSIKVGRRVVVPTAAVRRVLQLDSGTDAA
jgi:hypothetical protein